MPSFYEANADLFSLDPDRRKRTMAEDLTQRRQYVAETQPTVAAQLPPLPGQPGPAQGAASVGPGAPPQRPADLSQFVNAGATLLAQSAAQQQAQGQPQPTDEKGAKAAQKTQAKTAEQMIAEIQQMFSEGTNPLQPRTQIGPDIGSALGLKGAGGILGLGVSPIDVLAFAAGTAATWRLPQDKAIPLTMSIARLPSELREKQSQVIKDTIGEKLKLLGLMQQGQQLEQSELKTAQTQQQLDSRAKLANAHRLVGREDLALAIEANMVDEYVKLTGQKAEKLPPQLQLALSGVASGRLSPRDAGIPGVNNPQDAKDWINQHLRSMGVTPTTEGVVFGRSAEGPVAITQDPNTGAFSRTIIPSVGAPSGAAAAAQQPPAGPRTALAPQVQPQPQQQPGQPPVQPGQPQTPTAPATPDDVKVGNMEAQLTQETGRAVPVLPRSMDATSKAKMLASVGTVRFADELIPLYEAMVKSYGGDKKFDFSTRSRIYGVAAGPSLSGEGLMGQAISMAGKYGSAALQEMDPPLTPEAQAYVSKYLQAQRFARGALQDAANLAVSERGRFEAMLGSVLDTPSQARKKLRDFRHESARDYNDLLKANQRFFTGGFQAAPLDTPGMQSAPQRSQTTPQAAPRIIRPEDVQGITREY